MCFLGDPWVVTTVTGSETGQGAAAAVSLVIYGDKAYSEPVVIFTDPNLRYIEEGKTDEHKVR